MLRTDRATAAVAQYSSCQLQLFEHCRSRFLQAIKAVPPGQKPLQGYNSKVPGDICRYGLCCNRKQQPTTAKTEHGSPTHQPRRTMAATTACSLQNLQEHNVRNSQWRLSTIYIYISLQEKQQLHSRPGQGLVLTHHAAPAHVDRVTRAMLPAWYLPTLVQHTNSFTSCCHCIVGVLQRMSTSPILQGRTSRGNGTFQVRLATRAAAAGPQQQNEASMQQD